MFNQLTFAALSNVPSAGETQGVRIHLSLLPLEEVMFLFLCIQFFPEWNFVFLPNTYK